MKPRTLSLILILTLILAGCSAADMPAEGQSWLLDSLMVNGTDYDLSTAQPITLIFDTNQVVGGSSGCNSYFGELEFNRDGTISPGNFGSTEMACETGMDVEAAYLSALGRTDSYQYSQYQLTLTADDGQTLLVYQLMRGQ